jgi:hypothetical protein
VKSAGCVLGHITADSTDSAVECTVIEIESSSFLLMSCPISSTYTPHTLSYSHLYSYRLSDALSCPLSKSSHLSSPLSSAVPVPYRRSRTSGTCYQPLSLRCSYQHCRASYALYSSCTPCHRHRHLLQQVRGMSIQLAVTRYLWSITLYWSDGGQHLNAHHLYFTL